MYTQKSTRRWTHRLVSRPSHPFPSASPCPCGPPAVTQAARTTPSIGHLLSGASVPPRPPPTSTSQRYRPYISRSEALERWLHGLENLVEKPPSEAMVECDGWSVLDCSNAAHRLRRTCRGCGVARWSESRRRNRRRSIFIMSQVLNLCLF